MAVPKRSIQSDTHIMALCNGDRMLQSEFHTAYQQMPEGYRAELIGGIVFEPSPLGYSHGRSDVRLAGLFDAYVIATPGIEAASNATVILSDEDEVQPDLLLRITNRYRGQSRASKFISGAPELVAEIAHSSRAIDLHIKKERYAIAGVIEYIVVSLEPAKLYWFDLRSNSELAEYVDGIIRSVVFPGLWIHSQGLLDLDHVETTNALNAGLESAEHEQFKIKLAKLARQRKPGRD